MSSDTEMQQKPLICLMRVQISESCRDAVGSLLYGSGLTNLAFVAYMLLGIRELHVLELGFLSCGNFFCSPNSVFVDIQRSYLIRGQPRIFYLSAFS